MPRTLADGKTKFTLLTTKPANPEAPTATELNAGIDASMRVLASDFTFGPADSDRIAEKPLGAEGNANAIGAGNYTAAATFWRYFATAGGFDATEDAAFEAVKVKGTTLWAYARRTDKRSTDAWAANDEIYLGAELATDNPQPPGDAGGFIKWRVPFEVQVGWPFITVSAAV